MIDWTKFAAAVTCNLEWERLCERGAYLGELSLHRTIAEYLQCATNLKIETEFNHPDIPGNKRLDIIGFGPQGANIQLAVEAKWIKTDGGTRYWHNEAAEDIFRLEMLSTNMAPTDYRCIIISGITANVQKELINKKKRVAKGKPMIPWIDAILPSTKASASRKIDVRSAKTTFRSFFKDRCADINITQLPTSYKAQLVASHLASKHDQGCVQTYV